ncbi:hypothetical protein QQF64_018594 [Cirrhinus molitorella]|uniref:Uncharacterized protein n=1 Tax=Cirrhinus molitorella TaxID=172907 RepID=A0ABR3LD69_9TELE
MCRVMVEEEAANKLKSIPLSNDTSMAPDLHDVLKVVVAAVNFVKSRPLKSRLFAKLWTEMGAAHDRLLFHAEWMAKLAYLADIFSCLNGLNLSIQDVTLQYWRQVTINAFRRKIDLWVHKLQRGITDMFPNLSELLDANGMGVDFILNTVTSHLTSLNEHFSHYFPDTDMEKYDWVQDPFSCDVMASGLSGKPEDELLELSSDPTLRI